MLLLDELADWMARKGFGIGAEFRALLCVPTRTDHAASAPNGAHRPVRDRTTG
jgi:hypothetical protein